MGRATILAVALLCVCVGAVPYSKYGRTCRDINCLSNQVCVMREKSCTDYDSTACGRYPTCEKQDSLGTSCSTMLCPSGQYCRTENGKPTCVNTVSNLGYDSAGVASVNGQQTSTSGQSDPGSRHNANINPYANANAPPPEDDHSAGKPSYNPASGYPPYPSQTGSNNNNNGYPPYPSNNNHGSGRTDLGYPPYPTQNRMPLPGQSYPGYPSSNGQYPGMPQYPPYSNSNKNYPGGSYHQNYPYSNKGGYNSNSIFRRNAACGTQATILTLTSVLISAVLAKILQANA